MRRRRLSGGILLALLAIPAFAAPAGACRYSRPIFTAGLPGSLATTQVRVRVSEALMIGAVLTAVRATVLVGSGQVRRGDRIVIVVPRSDTGNCYYGGFAGPGTVGADGVLEGYVILGTRRSSGAYPAWLSQGTDWSRYDDFAQGRRRGQWTRPRFAASGESSE